MFLKSFFRIFGILFICWLLLVWPFKGSVGQAEKLYLGIVVCAFIAYLEIHTLPTFPLSFPLSPVRFFWFIYYIFRFIHLMLIANLDVAYRVLHPSLPIEPGIVMVKTRLKNPMARLVLANSITLTPGTLVVDMTDDGTLYVHWIKVISQDSDIAAQYIVKPFEDILAKVFE
jgi:multicomponent Na+:H+ antiporter subunit E